LVSDDQGDLLEALEYVPRPSEQHRVLLQTYFRLLGGSAEAYRFFVDLLDLATQEIVVPRHALGTFFDDQASDRLGEPDGCGGRSLVLIPTNYECALAFRTFELVYTDALAGAVEGDPYAWDTGDWRSYIETQYSLSYGKTILYNNRKIRDLVIGKVSHLFGIHFEEHFEGLVEPDFISLIAGVVWGRGYYAFVRHFEERFGRHARDWWPWDFRDGVVTCPVGLCDVPALDRS
jgi:hypothetical protein